MDEPDLTFELVDVRDEATPQRDGSFKRVKRYSYYLGKYGPFTERIALDDPDPQAFQRLRDKQLQHLRDLHR